MCVCVCLYVYDCENCTQNGRWRSACHCLSLKINLSNLPLLCKISSVLLLFAVSTFLLFASFTSHLAYYVKSQHINNIQHTITSNHIKSQQHTLQHYLNWCSHWVLSRKWKVSEQAHLIYCELIVRSLLSLVPTYEMNLFLKRINDSHLWLTLVIISFNRMCSHY